MQIADKYFVTFAEMNRTETSRRETGCMRGQLAAEMARCDGFCAVRLSAAHCRDRIYAVVTHYPAMMLSHHHVIVHPFGILDPTGSAVIDPIHPVAMDMPIQSIQDPSKSIQSNKGPIQ